MVNIKFVNLKTINESTKYDIVICASLFKMKNFYRDFNEYINKFLLWLPKIPRNSYVRLYIDNTVLDSTLFKELLDEKKYPHLEIILYECEEYLDSEDYHDGTFGTMMRFIPLFQLMEMEILHLLVQQRKQELIQQILLKRLQLMNLQ